MLRSIMTLILFLLAGLTPRITSAEFTPSGNLEIHYINVGQGGCTLIIGPNGTRVLYDFGNVGGDRDIVPYLRDAVGLAPTEGLHYTIVSHRDMDHYKGYKDVVDAGYNVWVANYGSGSTKSISTTMRKYWLNPAKQTAAGKVRPIPVGLNISLGDGAELIVVYANGRVIGQLGTLDIDDENDKSVALFVRYGDFQYLIDGDLGSGEESCTDHQTGQADLQTFVASALTNLDLMDEEYGVDVLHIAHHGSESSTSAAYYNRMKPEVGLISVGLNQRRFRHPREDVVDLVLVGDNRADCVTAPPLQELFQTEDGKEGSSSTGNTSFTGLSIGDIKLSTDGTTGYTITGSNRVHGGAAEADPQDNTWIFEFDEQP